MTVRFVPTLAFMADVYRRSTEGGARSERFLAYTTAAREGTPVHGYNPMTSKPVGATVDALLAIDAEAVAAAAADDVASTLGHTDDELMHFTVATPGMWTDRLATEVEHRLLAKDPGGVLWWFDDVADVTAVESAARAQAARLVSVRRHGPPQTLRAAVAQEGAAAAASGLEPRVDDAAAAALDVLGDDTGLPSMVAFLWGDDGAREMGFTPIGLDAGVGIAHAVAVVQPSLPGSP